MAQLRPMAQGPQFVHEDRVDFQKLPGQRLPAEDVGVIRVEAGGRPGDEADGGGGRDAQRGPVGVPVRTKGAKAAPARAGSADGGGPRSPLRATPGAKGTES